MSKNSLDRVEKWGKFLTELSEINRNCKEKNIRKRTFNYKKPKFLACYLSLEEKAQNFQPEKLTNKLSCSIRYGTSFPQTVLLHDFQLDSKDSYKYLILEAFKTKVFLKAFWVDKIQRVLFGLFVFIFIFSLFNGVFLYMLLFIEILRHEEDWLVLALLGIGIPFLIFGCINAIWTVQHLIRMRWQLIKETFFWSSIVNTVTITNHRQIKLPELRLLFLELEKFQLKPNLLITKNNINKVTFELKVKSNPDLIGLLE